MIELFDAQRLLPRRDWSLPLAAVALLLLLLGMGAYGWTLQSRLQGAERARAALQQQLQQLRGQPLPSATLLADLQREAERLEAANRSVQGADAGVDSVPSQWLTRMATLGSADISLSTIEFDRAGVVRIDGMANSPQAVSRFLQAWDRAQPEPTPVRARALEVRQDPATAPLLRFQLRATAPLPTGRP